MKRDIKYILKRIIIGVGVALVLANINKCNVFADSPTTNLYLPWNLTSISNIQYDYAGTPYVDISSLNLVNTNIILNFTDRNNSYLNAFSGCWYNSSRNDYILFTGSAGGNVNNYTSSIEFSTYNYGGNVPTWFGTKLYNSSDSSQWINPVLYMSILASSSDAESYYESYFDTPLVSTSISINGNTYYYLTSQFIYNNQIINNQAYLKYTPTFFTDSNFQFYPFYSRNNHFTNYIFNNEELESTDILIPNGFSKIDLSGGQAVYFIPKDYNDIQIETIRTGGSDEYPLYTNYIDFNYYYKGSIKDGYFPLNDLDSLQYNNQYNSSQLTYIDSYFPMYQNGNQLDGYSNYSYIIFNNYETENSEIYYNSVLFNAFIIEDFSTYNEESCYIDRDDSNVCVNIDFAIRYENFWLKGFDDDNSSFANGDSPTGKLSKFFEILKFPFDWLKSLTNYNCSSISIPIPYTSSSADIICLSPVFKASLGDTFYNLLFYIITGLYAYRITLMNIDTFTDVLDPTDDKLEVVEL